MAFADSLKETVESVFGIPLETLYGTDSMKNGPSPVLWEDVSKEINMIHRPMDTRPHEALTVRELLQIFGTDVCRRFYKNFWCDLTFRTIEKTYSNNPYVLISDVRFPNEADGIRERGGLVIRLTRNWVSKDAHSSEIALDSYEDFDIIIDNKDLSIEESQVILLEKLKEKGITFDAIH